MKLTDDRAERALRYLAETDERAAELKTAAERCEFKARAIKDAMFCRLEGGVTDRQAQAGASAEYEAAMVLYFLALEEWEKVRNKRATEAIVIECWRSVQANRRAGNV